MTTTELFLVAMLIVFSAPYLLWRVARTDYYAPLVVVQIIGGVLLGPGILGALFPAWHASVFNPEVITALNGIAWWAVMLFVFVAGVELDLGAAWQHRRETLVTASCALFVPLAIGCGAALLLLGWRDGWAGAEGARWQVVLGIGMACAVTALPILVLLLEKMAVLRHPLGQRILRYASLDDIAIWGVLALILLDWERVGRQAGFLLLFPVAATLVRMVMRRLAEPDRWYASLIWLAACGLAADWAGLHYMVGAFLAGAIIDARWFDQARMDQFRATLLLAVMPVFFLSTGLRTDWSMGGVAVLGGALVLLAASVAGKLAGVQLAGRILKWPRGEAGLIGWLLQTKALIMIIFANILLDRAIISAETFTALLLMAVLSTMLTTPMVAPRLRRMGIRPTAG
ncbi:MULTISPECIES: cation:proton antiporter [Sphingomonas]|jgi:Kef-type K+ transport system membrane component KefB|uniref:Cation:proton antiporter n=1 Tax=Sphingomonas olei TaxID=1886787 RepID=A0ABY2QIC2_9SPHN|nr:MULTISPECIES: cation:proton antiporter [Sphingomonas]KKI17462.1 sodium:proton exchanger [Sphingomonas sp. Ag1]MDF2603612.1 cation/H(+) antiporter [Sphingomonas sp.]THG40394.1 cation:proton antiporter [Sphingomonas olei]